MRLPPILWGALVKTMQVHGVAQRIPQQPQWLLLYYSASPAGNQRDSPCDNDMIEVTFTILVNGTCPSYSASVICLVLLLCQNNSTEK